MTAFRPHSFFSPHGLRIDVGVVKHSVSEYASALFQSGCCEDRQEAIASGFHLLRARLHSNRNKEGYTIEHALCDVERAADSYLLA